MPSEKAQAAWKIYQAAIRKAQKDVAQATQKAYDSYMAKMEVLSKAADAKRKAAKKKAKANVS